MCSVPLAVGVCSSRPTLGSHIADHPSHSLRAPSPWTQNPAQTRPVAGLPDLEQREGQRQAGRWAWAWARTCISGGKAAQHTLCPEPSEEGPAQL